MKRRNAFIIIIILVAVTIAVTPMIIRIRSATLPAAEAPVSYTKNDTSSSPLQSLAHIFIIVEENKSANSVIGSANAPYLNMLAKQYAVASNYSGITHPSLPNYLALTSGSTQGVTTDCNPPSAGCIVNATNLGDGIEKASKTWKAYAEDMPSPCYAYNVADYATKHNPFIYYTDIFNNQSRCKKHIVPFSELATDLGTTATTPNYALITPNLCHDMHDCSVASGDAWLASTVPTILSSPAFRQSPSVLVITWDEGTNEDNHIPTILAGSAVKPHTASPTPYSHYSLLHTIETAWHIAPMAQNDAAASIMDDLLK